MEIIYKILVNTKTNNYYLNVMFIKYITYFFFCSNNRNFIKTEGTSIQTLKKQTQQQTRSTFLQQRKNWNQTNRFYYALALGSKQINLQSKKAPALSSIVKQKMD